MSIEEKDRKRSTPEDQKRKEINHRIVSNRVFVIS
jgi:hypothetical protein